MLCCSVNVYTSNYLIICSLSGAITTTASAVTAATAPPEPACTNGKLFETCGTACPLTCDNYRSPPFACPAVCVMGCFCPQGLVELGNTCVHPTSCPGELPWFGLIFRNQSYLAEIIMLLMNYN